MKLLAVVLLLLPLSGCLAEVVNDFTVNCSQFFATPNGVVSPPTRFSDNNNQNRYKQICQMRDNKIEFATYYDTVNRIPVYSAYRFEGLGNCTRKTGNWFIEPQLDDPQRGGNNMRSQMKNCGTNQALNDDYAAEKVNNIVNNEVITTNKYHRGHLAPVYHANTNSCAKATFTLTNAAPQNSSFNSGLWRVTEGKMGIFLNNRCINKGLRAFVVTGVVPGNTTMNNRVRVPSHFWTAYCCLDNNNITKYSQGCIGENLNKEVQPKNVSELENELGGLYNRQLSNGKFTLFGVGCYSRKRKFRPISGRRKKMVSVQSMSDWAHRAPHTPDSFRNICGFRGRSQGRVGSQTVY